MDDCKKNLGQKVDVMAESFAVVNWISAQFIKNMELLLVRKRCTDSMRSIRYFMKRVQIGGIILGESPHRIWGQVYIYC